MQKHIFFVALLFSKALIAQNLDIYTKASIALYEKSSIVEKYIGKIPIDVTKGLDTSASQIDTFPFIMYLNRNLLPISKSDVDNLVMYVLKDSSLKSSQGYVKKSDSLLTVDIEKFNFCYAFYNRENKPANSSVMEICDKSNVKLPIHSTTFSEIMFFNHGQTAALYARVIYKSTESNRSDKFWAFLLKKRKDSWHLIKIGSINSR